MVAVAGLLLIFGFVIASGAPLLLKVGLPKFLLGADWHPTAAAFGILPLLAGTLLVVALATVIGGTSGVVTAVFLSQYCPRPLRRPFKTVIELLAGIPSVIYGFFGVILLVPFVRTHVGGNGYGVLSASIILGIMILPTVTAISECVISAVPRDYKLAGLGLGATDWQVVSQIILPASAGGLATAVVLGVGRAVGETMAVLMVIGNAPQMPTSLLRPASALTSTIALDMAYASGLHRTALFAIGIVLLCVIMTLVWLVSALSRRAGVAR